jgi:hypothetical protein
MEGSEVTKLKSLAEEYIGTLSDYPDEWRVSEKGAAGIVLLGDEDGQGFIAWLEARGAAEPRREHCECSCHQQLPMPCHNCCEGPPAMAQHT